MTLRFTRTVGQSEAVISVHGPKDAETYQLRSWSLSPLQKQCPPGTEREWGRLATGVGDALRSLGVPTAYAPRVGPASAKIVETNRLEECIRLENVRLFRQHDLDADGVFLDEEEAFVMSAAGCPVIIASGGGHFVVAHAARDSLIDRLFINGVRSRLFTSVVDNIVLSFLARGVLPLQISMAMFFSIAPKRFEHSPTHPIHGAYNRALIAIADSLWPKSILRDNECTYLDLEQVFVAQAHGAGVRKVWVEYTLDSLPELVQSDAGTEKGKRNLIIVKRTA